MNHGCARTWVRTRRAAVLAALTLLVVGCGATGSPVDTTTAAPTTTTTATTTGAGASATPTAPTSTSVSLPGGLLVTDPPHNAVQPFPAAGSCHARQAANGVLPDPACTPGAVDPHVTDATLESTVCRRGGYTSTVRPPTSVTNSEKRLAQAATGRATGPRRTNLTTWCPSSWGVLPTVRRTSGPSRDPPRTPRTNSKAHCTICSAHTALHSPPPST